MRFSPYRCIPSRALLFAVGVLAIVLLGCSSPSAEQIVDRAIEAHGGERFRHAEIRFTFRGDRYTRWRDGGRYRYERRYTAAGRPVREVLANDTLYRTVGGEKVDLTPSQRASVRTTVNSVVYFAVLPYRLDDPAVQTELLGTTTVEGEPYWEVEVTFQREDGGPDWEDRFVYWIHRDAHTMDYLAYYYYRDGGGHRFRRAVNRREVGGLLLADYLNYTSAEIEGTAVEAYDSIYENRPDRLELVSEIRMEEVEVEPIE